MLLKDASNDTLLPEIIRSRTGPAGELKISKTILNRVFNGGQAILCKDLAQEFPESAERLRHENPVADVRAAV